MHSENEQQSERRPDDPGGSAAGLTTDQVSVAFAGLRAVKDVSLMLHDGEILGLIGPNGAGKTTLMNAITGLVSPTGGRVLIDDTDLTSLPTHKRARAGIARTFQDLRLFRSMSVYENVEAGGLSSGLRGGDVRNRTDEMLERMGLAEHTAELAGGLNQLLQRQLAIARALVSEPRFLLLDEPGAGLSEDESDELLSTLLTVREESGCGLLVVEHDMRLIMRLCDRIHVLNDGATIATGAPREIQNDPHVVEAYLGAA